MSHLESCREVDDDLNDLIRMVNSVEKLQIHLELVLSILNSQCAEEVENSKKKYKTISKFYEQIKTKEDIAVIPVQYMLTIFHDKMFLELKKFVKNCFQKNSFGEVHLKKNVESLARIKILVSV